MNNVNIILYQPEIAGNVGSIIRTCVAANFKLHIIQPIGFFWDERFLKRASVDNLKNMNYELYDDFEDFSNKNKNVVIFYSTRYGKQPHSDINFKNAYNISDIYIMFGKESTGIPLEILKEKQKYCFRIPMHKSVRSLNLSNCVAIIVYEVLRQINYPNLSKVEIQKGQDWLDLFDK